MIDVLGPRLVETFEAIKMAELERFRAWVTDWEFAEYSQLLEPRAGQWRSAPLASTEPIIQS
jgi:hypothetical protein